jgi:hypothetical protein
MEWVEIKEPQGNRWLPKSQVARLEKAKSLADALSDAHRAFRAAKRKREKPTALKKLRAKRDAAQTAYDNNRKEVAQGFYIKGTGRGFAVRTWDGHTHSVHPTLKEAQAERPKVGG